VQENQKQIEEKSKPVLKVGLVGWNTMTSGAVTYYLNSEHHAEVVVLDDYRKPTAAHCRTAELDVVVLGANQHSLKELENLQVISSNNDGPKIAVYFDNFESNFAWAVLRHGAAGIISGDTNVQALPSILELIASGEVFVPSSMIASGPKRVNGDFGDNCLLQDTEETTLRMIAEGHINKEIALKLDVSEMHVKLIVRNICKALDARNRAHAVAKAIRLGLI
jgi:DNA-binding NarL/FixJ family response regulator